MKNHMYPSRGVQSGCKDCKTRHIGCHIDCESYISFKKEIEEIREKRYMANLIRNTLAENEIRRKHSSIRKNKNVSTRSA